MKKAHQRFNQYVRFAFVNFSLFLVILLIGSLALDRLKLLTAPQFVASLSFDEKIRFFKEEKPNDPDILALGSSITMNHLDASLLKDRDGDELPFVNMAAYGLQINELQNLAEFSTQLVGQPKVLLVVSAPVDFKTCPAATDPKPEHYVAFEQLNQKDAINYIRSATPTVFYHAKYRSLWRMLDPNLLKTVHRLRTTNNTLDSLKFDRSGSVLLNVPRENVDPERWEGDAWAASSRLVQDPQRCYQSLHTLAQYAQSQQMKLVFVLSPIRAGFLDRVDPFRQQLLEHQQQVVEILQAYDAIVLDAHQDLSLRSDEYFADAMHLNQKGAQRLTQYISQKLNKAEFDSFATASRSSESARSH